MPRTYTNTVTHPLDENATLEVEYTARQGTADTWEEPGDPAEYELEKAINECGIDVLPSLSADQSHAIWEKIAEEHDWSVNDDYYDDLH